MTSRLREEDVARHLAIQGGEWVVQYIDVSILIQRPVKHGQAYEGHYSIGQTTLSSPEFFYYFF